MATSGCASAQLYAKAAARHQLVGDPVSACSAPRAATSTTSAPSSAIARSSSCTAASDESLCTVLVGWQFTALSNAVAAQEECGGQLWSVSAGLEVTARESRSHKGHAHLKDSTALALQMDGRGVLASAGRDRAERHPLGSVLERAGRTEIPALLRRTCRCSWSAPRPDSAEERRGAELVTARRRPHAAAQADALAAQPAAVDQRLPRAWECADARSGPNILPNPDGKDNADPHTRGDLNWWDKVWRDWMGRHEEPFDVARRTAAESHPQPVGQEVCTRFGHATV